MMSRWSRERQASAISWYSSGEADISIATGRALIAPPEVPTTSAMSRDFSPVACLNRESSSSIARIAPT